MKSWKLLKRKKGNEYMLVFHGTNYKNEILENGFRDIFKSNGQHFGKGIYLTDNIKKAEDYGKDVLKVEVDENKLLHFNGMDEFNSFGISILPYVFENYFIHNETIGFILKCCDDSNIVYVPYYNKDKLNIIFG